MDVCYASAPEQMRPMIRSMVDRQNFNTANACDLIIDHTIDRMSRSFQTFFDKQFAAGEQFGSSIDYILRIGTQTDSSSDLCTNFQVISVSLSLALSLSLAPSFLPGYLSLSGPFSLSLSL